MPNEVRNGATPFVKWALGLLGGLATLGAVGGVRLYASDSGQEERIKENEKEIEQHDALVQQIPVITEKIENLEEKMDDEHDRILEAIKDLKD